MIVDVDTKRMLNKVKLLLLVSLLTTSAALEDDYVCDIREYDQLIMDCRNEVGETHEFVEPTEEEKNLTDVLREMAECKSETEEKLGPETFCREPYSYQKSELHHWQSLCVPRCFETAERYVTVPNADVFLDICDMGAVFLTLGTCYLGKENLRTRIVEKSGINQEPPLHDVFSMFQMDPKQTAMSAPQQACAMTFGGVLHAARTEPISRVRNCSCQTCT